MQSLLLICVTLCCAEDPFEQLRWVDHFPQGDKDIYFDRVVAIVFDGETVVRASGLLITKSLVLTTYNPFRADVVAGREGMAKLKIISLRSRIIFGGGEYVNYTFEESKIACGRQILPVEDDANVWHMRPGEQSPLHDLMVLKLDKPLQVRNKTEIAKFAFNLNDENEMDAGPIVSLIASKWARLGDDLKIASYGHVNRKHVRMGLVLRSFEFPYDEHVRADCDEWLPRGWGYFICLHNLENFPAVASGAVLVHKDLVYGLGSFFLEKGENKSILVFTDVRPYLNLIYNACKNTEKKP